MGIILASTSPRRIELLGKITKHFTVEAPTADEDLPAGTAAARAAELIAARKAGIIAEKRRTDLVVGADTVVSIGERILGKPADDDDAFSMLTALSGRTHSVHTGVCLCFQGRQESFVSTTRVTFYPLSPDEICRYIAGGEPMDKAGGYGIQGTGGLFVRSIDGDFYTVVGLPVAKLYWRLKNYTMNFPFPVEFENNCGYNMG